MNQIPNIEETNTREIEDWKAQLKERAVWSSQCSNIKVLTLGQAERLIQEALAQKDAEVSAVRDQEAKLWFETWYSHYIAPDKPLSGEFGRFATERIQMTGYQRDHAITTPKD